MHIKGYDYMKGSLFPSINEFLKHRVIDYIWIIKNFINDFQKKVVIYFQYYRTIMRYLL